MTIVAFSTLARRLQVVFLGLKNERQLVDGGCCGKIPHQLHVQFYIVIPFFLIAFHALIEHHFAPNGLINKVGVGALNDGCGLLVALVARHLHIKFVATILLELDVETHFLQILFTFRQAFGRQILQHFQLIGALSDGSP